MRRSWVAGLLVSLLPACFAPQPVPEADSDSGSSTGPGEGTSTASTTNPGTSEGTTILGFSGILFANHRGLNSMAWVAVIGMALALLASVVVLPLLLDLLSRRRGAERRGLQETEKRPR